MKTFVVTAHVCADNEIDETPSFGLLHIDDGLKARIKIVREALIALFEKESAVSSIAMKSNECELVHFKWNAETEYQRKKPFVWSAPDREKYGVHPVVSQVIHVCPDGLMWESQLDGSNLKVETELLPWKEFERE